MQLIKAILDMQKYVSHKIYGACSRNIAQSFVLVLGLFLSSMACSMPIKHDLKALKEGALSFVLESQIQVDTQLYRTGEWPATVQGTSFWSRSILGAPNHPTDDPNAFVLASIHNILSFIYLADESKAEILPVLAKAGLAVENYRQADQLFNFWPRAEEIGPDAHFPRIKFVNDEWQGMLAMPADADTNAAVQLMLLLRKKIANKKSDILQSVGDTYSRFRDEGRLFPHWHNLLMGESNTGAFMTFFDEEPIFPTFVKAFSSPSEGPRIPAEKNTVDCVVNSNVLRTLALYKETDIPGYSETCELVNDEVKRGLWNECGNYYPQTYWMHYAVANAFSSGAICLADARLKLRRHILSSQEKNGSWLNEVIAGESVQATAFALNALLLLGDPHNSEDRKSVRSAIKFLESTALSDHAGRIYWPDGTFFSAGGPLFRDKVVWKSKSFTTALVLQALYHLSAWQTEI